MFKLVLYDPVGVVDVATRQRAPLVWGPGSKLATLFNNHVSSHRVWRRLEALLEQEIGAPLTRLEKENTFAEAPRETVEKLVKEADLAIVGVGA